MQNDLISRSALIEKINDTSVEISFDLPVEEMLGEDVDMDDFCTLLQDAIQAYRKMVIGVIQEQPVSYDVEKVVAELETQRNVTICKMNNQPYGNQVQMWYRTGVRDAIDIVRNGGKE